MLSPESAVTVVRTAALTRRFGSKVAVDAVSIAVAGGESFALLRPDDSFLWISIVIHSAIVGTVSGDRIRGSSWNSASICATSLRACRSDTASQRPSVLLRRLPADLPPYPVQRYLP